MEKKSQKGVVALVKAQKHCRLEFVCLLALAKTSFPFILHYFKCLLTKKYIIEYMYAPMLGVVNDIKTHKTSYEYCEVVHFVFHTMKEVVVSVHKNELLDRLWLLLDAVMEIVGIYLFCCDK